MCGLALTSRLRAASLCVASEHTYVCSHIFPSEERRRGLAGGISGHPFSSAGTPTTRLVKWTPRVPASPALPALPHTQYTHTQSHNCRHGSRLGAGRRGWDAAEQRSRGRLAAASEARLAGTGFGRELAGLGADNLKHETRRNTRSLEKSETRNTEAGETPLGPKLGEEQL